MASGEDDGVTVKFQAPEDATEAERLAAWKKQLAMEAEEFDADDTDSDGSDGGVAAEAADAIRKRYGVAPAAAPGGGATAAGGAAGAGGDKFQGDFEWNGWFGQVQELTQKNTELLALLDHKDKEISRLETLVVATEPVPGVDAERLLSLVNEDGESVGADPRDVKIVQLSKRNRNLNLALQKHKARASKLQADAERYKEIADSKVYPKRLQPAPDDDDESKTGSSETIATLEAQVKALTSRSEMMRMKLERTQSELKATQRALAAEVGPDASLEDIVESATQASAARRAAGRDVASGPAPWRGRAQKIVMLKSKLGRAREEIAELRERLGEEPGSPSRDSATVMTRRTAATSATGMTKRFDVDSAARADLQDMSRERAKVVEQLTESYQTVSNELEAANKRADAAKARIKVLEKERGRAREHVKTLLDKTDTDNKLIDALREELEPLRLKARQLQLAGKTEQKLRAEMEQLHQQLKHYKEAAHASSSSASGSVSGRPPPAGGGRGGMARRGSSGRPSSAEVRKQAEDAVRAEEASAQARMLQAENFRLKELLDSTNARARELESSQEDNIRRISELEIRCSNAEGAPGRGPRSKRSGDTGTSPASLSAKVKALTEENDALKGSFRAAVTARDAEIASLRATVEDQRRELQEAMAAVRRSVGVA